METFSPVHWIIAIALLAALGAFLYFVGSLLWAGAKQKGKGKLLVAAILLPIAVLAVIGLVGAVKSPEPQKPAEYDWWKHGGTPVN